MIACLAAEVNNVRARKVFGKKDNVGYAAVRETDVVNPVIELERGSSAEYPSVRPSEPSRWIR